MTLNPSFKSNNNATIEVNGHLLPPNYSLNSILENKITNCWDNIPLPERTSELMGRVSQGDTEDMNSDVSNSQSVISGCINNFNTGFLYGDTRLNSPKAPSLNPEIPCISAVYTALTFVNRQTTSPARFLEASPAHRSNLMIKRSTGVWAFNAKICSDYS